MEMLLKKLAGAGLSITILYIWAFGSSNFNLYETSIFMANGYVWLLFYGYGLVIALLSHFITRKLKSAWVQPIIYMVCGFSFFFVFGFHMITAIAGFFGALFALIFYAGEWIAGRLKVFRVIFAIIMPLFFIIFSQIDLTKKTNWEESYTKGHYITSFDWFNGEHRVPVELSEGEKILFTTAFSIDNYGGHGFKMKDNKNKTVGLNEVDHNSYSFTAKNAGTYYFVLEGNNASGKIEITWVIEP